MAYDWKNDTLKIYHRNAMFVVKLDSLSSSNKKGVLKLEMIVSFESHSRNLEFEDTVRVDLESYEYGLLLRPESVKTKKGKQGTIYTVKLKGEM